MNSNNRTPNIIISSVDYRRLVGLARSGRAPEVADTLLGELDRASIVEESALPDDVVHMHSRVTYRDERTGVLRTVQLVYPHRASLADDRLSVMTPVGAALIGLRLGQSMTWHNGEDSGTLTVVAVERAPASDTEEASG